MNTNEHKEEAEGVLLTRRIIGCAMRVHNTLGAGFLEKVYENALTHELNKNGIAVEQQKTIKIFYDDVLIGSCVADLIIEGRVLLELKATTGLADEHIAVCLNYLRVTKIPVCLLVNFGKPRLQIKRLVGDTYTDISDPI